VKVGGGRGACEGGGGEEVSTHVACGRVSGVGMQTSSLLHEKTGALLWSSTEQVASATRPASSSLQHTGPCLQYTAAATLQQMQQRWHAAMTCSSDTLRITQRCIQAGSPSRHPPLGQP
jgi:hypothetical protein